QPVAHRLAGRVEPAAQPAAAAPTEAAPAPLPSLPPGAAPAAACLHPDPRGGGRRKGPARRRSAAAAAVERPEPDRTLLQPAGGLAALRPVGDGRRTREEPRALV